MFIFLGYDESLLIPIAISFGLNYGHFTTLLLNLLCFSLHGQFIYIFGYDFFTFGLELHKLSLLPSLDVHPNQIGLVTTRIYSNFC